MNKKSFWTVLALVLFLPLLALAAGLFTASQEPAPVKPRGFSGLPNGAIVKQDLGSGWVIFELEVEGKNRKFLLRRYGIGQSELLTAVPDDGSRP